MADSIDLGSGGAPVDGYAAGVAALHDLVPQLPPRPPVTQGRMFNGDGLRVRGRMFAFIGRNGDLVVKLPEPRVRQLVDQNTGTAVVMGTRTMREWVRVSADAGVGRWSEALEEAHGFALTLTPS